MDFQNEHASHSVDNLLCDLADAIEESGGRLEAVSDSSNSLPVAYADDVTAS